MTRYSLRTRLVAVVVAVTVFAFMAGGVATWLALRQYLYGNVDSQLRDVLQDKYTGFQNSAAANNGYVPENDVFRLFVGGPGHGFSDGVAQQTLLQSNGKSVSWISDAKQAVKTTMNSDDPPDYFLDLKTSDGKTLARHQGRIYTFTTTDGQTVRAESVALNATTVLAVGVRIDAVQDTLQRLILLELAVGGAAIFAAIGLGTYGVRVGLHPLTRVSHTAREIAANLKSHGSGLERRVPPSDPRTEVGQLTDALNTMLGAAQVAYAQRVENEDRMRRFLADASHELRTPLTSLRGYAELERMRAATPGAEDADATQDALRRIETEGDRMARLVDDLLLLARTDQGSSAPELGPVAVDELLDEAADRASAAFPARPFAVDTPNTGLVFIGDREAMLQVLGNLLRNAAIHTPGPRPIRLGARPDGSSVLLLIADEGPGMKPEQAQHAFERFWRADSGRTRATGGTGLGLAIVHALVSSQHGAVGLTSDLATGTTVLVRMPGLVDGLGRLVHQQATEAPSFGTTSSAMGQPGQFTGPSRFEPSVVPNRPEVIEGVTVEPEAEAGRGRHSQRETEPAHNWWRSPHHDGSRTP